MNSIARVWEALWRLGLKKMAHRMVILRLQSVPSHTWKLHWQLCKGSLKMGPVEACTRILLSAGGDMFMACNVRNGIVRNQCLAQLGQRLVLRRFKLQVFKAFELNANRIVIAVIAPTPMRFACVPRAIITADKLPQHTLAGDEKVRRHFHPTNALKVRVCLPIQLIGKQLLNAAIAVFAWRQADGVHHEQVNRDVWWTRTKVG